jgi:hypothetical protein
MSTWRTRERWTEDDAVAALAALKRSGLSVVRFADREGLDRSGSTDGEGPAAGFLDFVELTHALRLPFGRRHEDSRSCSARGTS